MRLDTCSYFLFVSKTSQMKRSKSPTPPVVLPWRRSAARDRGLYSYTLQFATNPRCLAYSRVHGNTASHVRDRTQVDHVGCDYHGSRSRCLSMQLLYGWCQAVSLWVISFHPCPPWGCPCPWGSSSPSCRCPSRPPELLARKPEQPWQPVEIYVLRGLPPRQGRACRSQADRRARRVRCLPGPSFLSPACMNS